MENNQPIIIKRVKRFAAGHHGGAWKIAFADFATAMMAFFLVLWLMSTATPEQKIAIAGYFKDPIGFSESGTPFVIDLGGSPQLAPERTINPEVKTEAPQEKSRSSATLSNPWLSRSSKNALSCCCKSCRPRLRKTRSC